MQLRKSCSICLLLCLGLTATSVAQTIDFTPPVNPGTTINLTGSQGSFTILVYKAIPGAAACDVQSVPNLSGIALPLVPDANAPNATAPEVTGIDPSVTHQIKLASALNAGDRICMVAFASNAPGVPINSASLQVVTGAPAAPGVALVGPPITGDQTILLQGKPGDKVSAYVFPSSYVPLSTTKNAAGADLCTVQDVLAAAQQLAFQNPPSGDTASLLTLTANAATAQAAPLVSPLTSGELICIEDTTTKVFSYFATVKDAAPATPTAAFAEPPVGGTSTVLVHGPSGVNVSVYQFDAGHQPASANETSCQQDILQPGAKFQILAINATSGTGSSNTATLSSPDSAGNTSLTLANPLVPGWQLCLEEIPAATSSTSSSSTSTSTTTATTSPTYSGFVTVTDPNTFPKGRAYYTAGVMVTNENGSNGSSATAEYLDFGFLFAEKSENPILRGHRPGFNSFVDGLFSDLPVAASSSSTSSTASSGTLNILSTQESARVQGGIFVPIPTLYTTDKSSSYFVAPLAKAAFETLLNPAATSSTGTSGTTTSTVATFAPVYGYYAAGVRFGLRKYSRDMDIAPQTLFQGDITIGKYSNLQSFVCGQANSTETPTATPPTNTSCYTTTVPTGGTPVTGSPYYLEAQNRRVLPRMEFEGFFHFPNSPFVLGLDANLDQAALAPRNLDILNKPGGNVSIFFGVSGNLLSLFKSLSLTGAGQ